jgi:hypothetical protein
MEQMVTVDYGELARLADHLQLTAEALSGGGVRPDAGSMGGPVVASALDTFFSNWDYRRRALTERIDSLAQLVRHAAGAYRSTDEAIADACRSDASSATNFGGAAWLAVGAAAAPGITSIGQLRAGGRFSGSGAWAEANRVWFAMTDEQRRTLLTPENAAAVGADDRYPPDVRYAANRFLVEQESSRLHTKALLGPLTASEQHRLALYDRIITDHSHVLLFDPSGDGKIAVVDGDLATAKNVSVDVPGIDTTMDNFSLQMDDGHRLWRAAGEDAAIITWLGYDAPAGLDDALVDNSRFGQIVTRAYAEAGAPVLRGLADNIRANAAVDTKITVIGHSYGSLVVGTAGRDGLDADRVVFIGSPGTGVTSALDLNLPHGGHVYAMAHEGAVPQFGNDDPVPDLGAVSHVFGPLPTDPNYGATVLGAGTAVGGPHSSYYGAGSSSLAQLANVVSGVYDESCAEFVPPPPMPAISSW